MTEPTGTTRRRVLAGLAGVGIAALAGCGGARGADPVPDDAAGAPVFDGWLADTENYDGIVDATSLQTVTVAVGGADGLSFDPAAVRVDPGATVRWEWSGGGSAHNVVAADGAFESEYYTETGAAFERTFEDAGVVKYLCAPHAYAGMKGVIVVGW